MQNAKLQIKIENDLVLTDWEVLGVKNDY